MRIFIDANIIIDVLLNRQGFYEDASNVLKICENKKSALAPHTISNIFFITRKDYTAKERKKVLFSRLWREIFFGNFCECCLYGKYAFFVLRRIVSL
jgi:predicted nucleic acid-binding protein